jgi:hypothetical protein
MRTKKRTSQAHKIITVFFGLLGIFSYTFSISSFSNASAQEASTPTPSQIAPSPTRDVFPEPEIVGGDPANPGQWPWQVALVNSSATDFLGNNRNCSRLF